MKVSRTKLIELYLPILLACLYVLNYIIQHSILAGVYYHVFNLCYISLLGFLLFTNRISLFYVLSLFFFVLNHQYAADPYSDSFRDFISGGYKFIVLALLAPFISFGKNANALLGIILLISTIISVFNGMWFRSQYLMNDFFVCFFLLLFLMDVKIKPKCRYDISKIVFRFFLMLPLCCLIVYALGLHNELYGSFYFFYGPTYACIILFSTAYWIEKGYKLVSPVSLFILLNFILFLQSAQSAQLLIVFLALLVVVISRRKIKYFLPLAAFVVLFIFTSFFAQPGTWLYLKTNQVVSLAAIFTGDLSGVMAFNSIAIRISQLITIISSNNAIEMILGRGLGSIYNDSLGLLSSLRLGDATYPLLEKASGEFHLVHESWVFLYMKSGILGFLLVLTTFTRKIYGYAQNYSLIILYLMVFFYWSSSMQFVLFSFVLKLLISKSNNSFPPHYK